MSIIESTFRVGSDDPLRSSSRVWIGSVFAAISAAVLVGTYYWMNSRTFFPVDKPISLARGLVKITPFKINLRSNYEVRIDTGWEFYNDPNCPSYDRLKVRWRLTKDGNVFLNWTEPPYQYFGDFFGDPGTYELDLEVLSDTACLNPGHPRLLIFTDRSEYAERTDPITWVSAFGFVLGISLVIMGTFGHETRMHTQCVQIADSPSIGENFEWAQKLPLRKKFSSPPAFALLAAPGLVILIIMFMVILEPYPSKGFYVRLLKPGQESPNNDSLIQPIIIQLQDTGPTTVPRVCVNSKSTSWKDLNSELRSQLKLRPEWVVYVEADPNVAWANVVSAIDIAKGLHARVVLLPARQSQSNVER